MVKCRVRDLAGGHRSEVFASSWLSDFADPPSSCTLCHVHRAYEPPRTGAPTHMHCIIMQPQLLPFRESKR